MPGRPQLSTSGLAADDLTVMAFALGGARSSCACMRGPFGSHAGIMMRMFVDHYLSRVASLASPGIDELRWATPLRPGDSLRLRTTILQARRSRTKPDRGLVHTRAELAAAVSSHPTI